MSSEISPKRLIERLVNQKGASSEFLEDFKALEAEPLWHTILLLLIETDQFRNLLVSDNPKEIELLAGELIENVLKRSKKDFLLKPGERLVEAIKVEAINSSKIVANLTLGIDLGTTNSVVAYKKGEKVEVIPNKSGNFLTPSIVNVGNKGKFIVGESARNQSETDPQNTFVLIKRLLGINPQSAPEELKSLLNDIQFQVHELETSYKVSTPNSSRDFECQEISAQVLAELYAAAKKYDRSIGTGCVVTVPAYFNNRQRIATKEAVEIAGLNLLQLINEPTAAAIAYGLANDDGDDRDILVADLGGGTFDLSLVEKDKDGMFFIVASLGDSQLGGEDFTLLILDYLKEEALKQNEKMLIDQPGVVSQFRSMAEQLKCEVSIESVAKARIPFIPTSTGETCSFEIELSQSELDKLFEPLAERVKELMVRFLNLERVKESSIDEVVLVGGSSRLPIFKSVIQEVTGKTPKTDLNPDLLVAQGAAICADLHAQNKPIQTLMCDVTPLTLGTSIVGDEFVPVIPANTNIPCSREAVFTTVEDYQEYVDVEVYQGERLVASENIKLGEFRHDQIEIAEAGIPTLEETYSIDLDGILTVTSKDSVTGVIKEISIKDSGNLSPSRIEELKFLASLNKKKDAATLGENKLTQEKIFEIQKIIRIAEKKRGYMPMTQLEVDALAMAKSKDKKEPNSFMAMN